MSDLIRTLRRWGRTRHLGFVPPEKLMDDAADEIERLEAAISESCEDDRSQILDRGWGGCLLSGKLNTKIERLETAFRMACGTISTMEQWKDKHPQDVVDEYLRLANERTR